MVAIEQADGFGEHYTPDDLADELGTPSLDLALDTFAVLDGEAMVAFGIITVPRAALDTAGSLDRALGRGAAVAPRSRHRPRPPRAHGGPGYGRSTGTGSRAPRAGSSSTRSITPPTGATCSSAPATRSSAGSSTWSAT